MRGKKNKRRSLTAIFSVKAAQECLIKHTTNGLKMKPNCLKKKFWTETLTEEFQPVALENYEFENRQNNSIYKTFLHFWPIGIPI